MPEFQRSILVLDRHASNIDDRILINLARSTRPLLAPRAMGQLLATLIDLRTDRHLHPVSQRGPHSSFHVLLWDGERAPIQGLRINRGNGASLYVAIHNDAQHILGQATLLRNYCFAPQPETAPIPYRFGSTIPLPVGYVTWHFRNDIHIRTLRSLQKKIRELERQSLVIIPNVDLKDEYTRRILAEQDIEPEAVRTAVRKRAGVIIPL